MRLTKNDFRRNSNYCKLRVMLRSRVLPVVYAVLKDTGRLPPADVRVNRTKLRLVLSTETAAYNPHWGRYKQTPVEFSLYKTLVCGVSYTAPDITALRVLLVGPNTVMQWRGGLSWLWYIWTKMKSAANYQLLIEAHPRLIQGSYFRRCVWRFRRAWYYVSFFFSCRPVSLRVFNVLSFTCFFFLIVFCYVFLFFPSFLLRIVWCAEALAFHGPPQANLFKLDIWIGVCLRCMNVPEICTWKHASLFKAFCLGKML